mmetsp:Transcript_9023/g.18134  ORF Transcript_9023/g.18134 Transcript_9023/m.18134 type:complete len:632 (-) Transcript_9023:49-1944(-)
MSATNNGNTKMKKKAFSGVDALLTTHGKSLAVGQGLSIRLIKGPSVTENPDPVDPKAPVQQFPILAKFPVSVVKPDFLSSNKRLYQQDVPKAVDDSDEEVADTDGQPKKRWKSRRKEVPQRQWILQEEVEFFETMLARRERQPQDVGTSTSSSKNKKLSTRYEGEPEQNSSHYIVLRVPRDDAVVSNEEVLQDGRCLQACLVPTNAMVAFAQPDARKTFSLSQAERVIEDQRNGVQTMHHLHDEGKNGEPQTLQQLLGRRRGKADQKPVDAKSRLLQKFQKLEASKNPSTEVDDGDDVMADVAYRNRKGAGMARKELLETVGDAKVSDEGVLGGANDSMFGGRQRFGQFKADDTNRNDNNNRRGGDDSAPQERGADGAAMADDFYSRDVEAEYKAMDFDANELFDDDSVDHGEKDVDEDNEGMVNLDDDDEDDDDESDEEEDAAVGGAAGLASAQGFKKLLEEAVRGKAPANEEAQPTSAADKGSAANGSGKKNIRKTENRNSHQSKLASILTGGRTAKTAKEEAHPMEVDTPEAAAAAVPAPRPMDPAAVGNDIGPDGLRILTQDSVRREIWLNHGSIEAKRLMKIFGVKKKLAERKTKFNGIVRELCTIEQDAVKGTMLVLKPHWSHMG